MMTVPGRLFLLHEVQRRGFRPLGRQPAQLPQHIEHDASDAGSGVNAVNATVDFLLNPLVPVHRQEGDAESVG
jgi:hypothetical protein